MKPIKLEFCAPLYTEIGGTLFFKKPVFDFSLQYPRKNGLGIKSKVCPLDTQIK